jgi:hypothetical protein
LQGEECRDKRGAGDCERLSWRGRLAPRFFQPKMIQSGGPFGVKIVHDLGRNGRRHLDIDQVADLFRAEHFIEGVQGAFPAERETSLQREA